MERIDLDMEVDIENDLDHLYLTSRTLTPI